MTTNRGLSDFNKIKYGHTASSKYWSMWILFDVKRVDEDKAKKKSLGLLCATPHSTIFQLYRGGHFYWRRKLECLRENLRPGASHWQTLSRTVVYSTPRLSRIRTHKVKREHHNLNDYLQEEICPLIFL